MARQRARGAALCAALAAACAGSAAAQQQGAHQFVTSLAGLGGTPIGLTPVGAPGTSTLAVNWLTDTDPDVRRAPRAARRAAARGAARMRRWGALRAARARRCSGAPAAAHVLTRTC
jgi:hypothetical protein